jgi:hypothetical protein
MVVDPPKPIKGGHSKVKKDRQIYQTYDLGIHARVWMRRVWRSVSSSSMFLSIFFGFSF